MKGWLVGGLSQSWPLDLIVHLSEATYSRPSLLRTRFGLHAFLAVKLVWPDTQVLNSSAVRDVRATQ